MSKRLYEYETELWLTNPANDDEIITNAKIGFTYSEYQEGAKSHDYMMPDDPDEDAEIDIVYWRFSGGNNADGDIPKEFIDQTTITEVTKEIISEWGIKTEPTY